MSNTTKTPTSPYYDDFDKAKKFLRVLFRPTYGVQTRELNQLQTILNDQISSFADYFFQNGQRVLGGQVATNSSQPFVKVAGSLAKSDLSVYRGLKVQNSNNSISGRIVHVEPATISDPTTLYIEYDRTSTDNVTSTFIAGESLTIIHDNGNEVAQAVSSQATGVGAIFSILEGIFYIQGQFVLVDEQSIAISKYTSSDVDPLTEVGFEIAVKTITPEQDTSLLDNALGTENETAPGAHRLSIICTLKKVSDVADLNNFVKISTLQFGKIVTQTRDTDFTVFEDLLAKRTFDESGDYVVDDFLVEIREMFDNGSNRGISVDGDPNKLAVILDPGVAYVRGYQVETNANTILSTDKARTTSSKTELLVDGSYESALLIKSLTGAPAFLSKIDLKQGSTIVGSAFVRSLSYKETELGDPIYRLDVFNLTLTSGSLSAVTNVSQASSSFTATVDGYIFNPKNSENIFPIPFGFIQNVSDLDLTYYREYLGTVNGTQLPITSAVNDQFFSGADNYVVVIAGVVKRPNGVTRTSNNTQATLDVSNFGSVNGQTAKIYAKTFRSGAIPRTKNLTEITQSIAAASSITLSKVDVASITSIKIGDVDYKSYYELDGGQRDTHYDLGTLKLKENFTLPVGTLEIKYKYFEHGSGDYFGPQSYENVEYKDIPFYSTSTGESVFLASVLDFRPRYLNANSYENPGAVTLSSVDDLSASFSYYLSRIDKVCLDKTGKFSIVKGIPAVTPFAPADLDASITLYELNIPAYTFDAASVTAKKKNLKRYTMQDIGKLETRVESVEYATSLSLLEVDANQRDLVDKFKSGFIVDNFKTQNVGDYENVGHQICIDMEKGEARPFSISNNIPLGYDSSSTSVVNSNGVVTLPFTEVAEISQLLASSIERIQPYTLFNWIGSTKLDPAVDTWVSTEVKPDIVLENRSIGTFQALSNPALALGSIWNWWGSATSPSQNVSGDVVGRITDIVSSAVQFTPIPYIRSRKVAFEAYGLKPNTKVIPYFDGVNVSQFVTPSGGVLGGPLIVSGAGTIFGTFEIPNSNSVRFRTGKRKFVLADVGQDPDAANTYTEATYVADGTLRSVQNKVINTALIENRPGARRRDPLAQSFAIEKDGGGFVTSIELFFGPEAAVNDQQVTVELRGITNGFPNDSVIARKILNPNQIIGSQDASVTTKFTFDYPVYLEQDQEYCFVVLSNSLQLTVWTATLGEKSRKQGDVNLNSGEVITKQPFIGSMFKSQNNVTWTASQTQDMKFKLNIAKFDLSGVLVLKNSVLASDVGTEADPYLSRLEFDPFEFTLGSNQMRVYDANHGFEAGDSVTLSGTSTGSLNGVAVSSIYGSRVIASTLTDSYVVTIGANATSSGRNGADLQRASRYVKFSTAFVSSENVVLNGTSAKYELNYKDSAVEQMVGFFGIENRTNESLGKNAISRSSNDGSVFVRVTMASTQDNLSPVIDIRKTSLVAVKNRVSNVDESLTSDSGALARYLQKPISLLNPANEIIVYADVNRPSVAGLKVYYKVGQNTPDEQSNWIELPATGVQASSESEFDFKEYKWFVTLPTEFFAAKIKIAFTSDDPSKVARIRNLRALYLNA